MEGFLGLQPAERLRGSSSNVGLTDGISRLHESILIHILSFLPTKDAIKFCTLSRHWSCLWKSVPSLSFSCVSVDPQEISRFVSFVDKTLAVYTSSKISKFSLEFRYPYSRAMEDKIESWIHFAKNRAVEEISINFKDRFYKKDGVLFDNGSAIKMNLTSMNFHFLEGNLSVHWTALKDLSLIDSSIKADDIRLVLIGSPVIEVLTIRQCTFGENDGSWYKCVIDASSRSLKHLLIDSCGVTNRVKGPFEITAPDLLSLTVVGEMDTNGLKLLDVSSLVEATIDFSLVWSNNGKDLTRHKKTQKSLLHKLLHVKRFTVGARSLQVVSMRSIEGAFFGNSRRKVLEVAMNLNMAYLPGIAALLNCSPDLEQLAIKILPKIDPDFKLGVLSADNDFTEENYWRSKMSKAESLFQNLEIVHIVGFFPGLSPNLGKIVVEIAQFILANATVLQKLIVHGKATNSHDESRTSRAESHLIFRKLLGCPRASSNAEVILKH